VKRVLLAGLFHETHTFLDPRLGLADAKIRSHVSLLEMRGDGSPMGAALEEASMLGWEVVPALDLRLNPGPLVKEEVFQTFLDHFEPTLKSALASGLDGILLILHGAMVTEERCDVEGDLLRRIRKDPAAKAIPIFGVYDLHAHFSDAMGRYANGLVAYRENPHTDAAGASRRAARLLDRAMSDSASGVRPKQFFLRTPILWPPGGTGSAHRPLRALLDLARELEARDDDFWAVSVNAGFAFGDVPDAGVAFNIISTGPELRAAAALQELGNLAWQLREEGLPLEIEPSSAIAKAKAFSDGLTVLAEPSDNIGAGAPGDGTGLLRAFLEQDVRNAAMAIADPSAVNVLWPLPLGTVTAIAIGGKGSRLDPGPVELNVELISRSDGRFDLENPCSHLASLCGRSFEMGPCAVVRHRGLLILLTSRPTPPMDLGQWHSQGIHPERLSMIGVKAAVAHRAAFDPIAARHFTIVTPGPCTSQLSALPYRRIRRPIFPLDRF